MSTRPFLLATPAPFIDESVTSWIQRVCAHHTCSIDWIRKQFQLPYRCDFDLDLGEREWARILLATGLPGDWFVALEHMRALRSVDLWDRYRQRNRENLTRWCPTCFSIDKVPYFRRTWRFGAGLCWLHGGPLRSRCPGCNTPLDLGVTVHRKAINLAHCQHCGVNLATKSRPITDDFLRRYLAGVRSEYKERIESVLNGHDQRREYRHGWQTYRLPVKRSMPLLISEIQFIKPEHCSKPWPKKWSARFERGSTRRIASAAALTLVRAELRKPIDDPSVLQWLENWQRVRRKADN